MNMDKSVASRGRLEASEFVFMAHHILSLPCQFFYESLVSGGWSYLQLFVPIIWEWLLLKTHLTYSLPSPLPITLWRHWFYKNLKPKVIHRNSLSGNFMQLGNLLSEYLENLSWSFVFFFRRAPSQVDVSCGFFLYRENTLLLMAFGIESRNTKVLILLSELCLYRIFIFLDEVAGQERSVEGLMLDRSNEIRSSWFWELGRMFVSYVQRFKKKN